MKKITILLFCLWTINSFGQHIFPPTSGGGATFNVISPSQLTSATDNWNPTDLATASVIRLSGDNAFRIISGITAPASAKELTLINVGTNYPVLITREDGASSAANRFDITKDIPLYPKQSVKFVYDLTTSRWRDVEKSPDREEFTGKQFGGVLISGGSTTAGDYDLWNFAPGATGNISGNAPTATRPRTISMSSGSGATNVSYITTKGASMYLGKTATTPNAIYTKVVLSLDNVSDGSNTFTITAGITANTSALTALPDGSYFRYIHTANSARWLAVSRTSSAETTTDSGVAVAAATVYTIEIQHRPDNSDAFFLNGVFVAEHTTNTHDGYAYPMFNFAKSVGTNPRVVQLDAMEFIESKL